MTKKKVFTLALLLTVLFVITSIVLQNDFEQIIGYFRNANLAEGNSLLTSWLTVMNNSSSVKESSKINKETACANSKMPFKILRKETWLPVNEERSTFVFSAYFVKNSRSTGEVVIIGVTSKRKDTYYCRIWYQIKETGSCKAADIPAKAKELPGGHGKRYVVVLLTCKTMSSLMPSYVSLLSKQSNVSLNLLSVHHPEVSKTEKRNFTVCLSPLNANFSRTFEFVEWVELNRILGAEKIIIYNHSSVQSMGRVLDYYSARGFTEIVQWPLPKDKENKTIEIHYFAQIAALNDCLYRNKNKTEFLINIDIDEFIIPRSKNVTTWIKMMQQLDMEKNQKNKQQKQQQKIAYIFRSTVFQTNRNNTYFETLSKTKVQKYKLLTLQKLFREQYIYDSGVRSKFIVKPADVPSIEIHTVRAIREITVPTETGLLHHYRVRPIRSSPNKTRVLDNTVPEKYGQELIRNVEDVWAELNKTDRSI